MLDAVTWDSAMSSCCRRAHIDLLPFPSERLCKGLKYWISINVVSNILCEEADRNRGVRTVILDEVKLVEVHLFKSNERSDFSDYKQRCLASHIHVRLSAIQLGTGYTQAETQRPCGLLLHFSHSLPCRLSYNKLICPTQYILYHILYDNILTRS